MAEEEPAAHKPYVVLDPDPIEQYTDSLHRIVSEAFIVRGIYGCCIPASALLYELLQKSGISASLRKGFISVLDPDRFAFHMWVEVDEKIYKTGMVDSTQKWEQWEEDSEKIYDVGWAINKVFCQLQAEERELADDEVQEIHDHTPNHVREVPSRGSRMDIESLEDQADAARSESMANAFIASVPKAWESFSKSEWKQTKADKPVWALRRDMLALFGPMCEDWKVDHKKTFNESMLCICGKLTTSICGRCKAAGYCSVECQKKNWPMHKGICHIMKE